MTAEQRRRVAGRIAQRLDLDFDEAEQSRFSTTDLYDLIRWHSGGKRPSLDRNSYRRQQLERMVERELGIDRRSSRPYFTASEYEDIEAVVEAAIEEQVAALREGRDQPDTTFRTAAELAGDGEL